MGLFLGISRVPKVLEFLGETIVRMLVTVIRGPGFFVRRSPLVFRRGFIPSNRGIALRRAREGI